MKVLLFKIFLIFTGLVVFTSPVFAAQNSTNQVAVEFAKKGEFIDLSTDAGWLGRIDGDITKLTNSHLNAAKLIAGRGILVNADELPSILANVSGDISRLNSQALEELINLAKTLTINVDEYARISTVIRGNNLGKITADQYQALKRELGDLSQRTDISLYYGIKGVQNSVNWKFVDGDVLSKIDSVFPHVRTIEGIKFKNNKWGFEGMHVERGLEEFVQANPGSRYELLNKIESPTGIYAADPKIILADGTELVKLNNQGKSTFFPRNWTDARIKEEVEHAVRYNEGLSPKRDPIAEPNRYYGFSKDGKIQIDFYLDRKTGTEVTSYFPVL